MLLTATSGLTLETGGAETSLSGARGVRPEKKHTLLTHTLHCPHGHTAEDRFGFWWSIEGTKCFSMNPHNSSMR